MRAKNCYPVVRFPVRRTGSYRHKKALVTIQKSVLRGFHLGGSLRIGLSELLSIKTLKQIILWTQPQLYLVSTDSNREGPHFPTACGILILELVLSRRPVVKVQN